MKLFIVFMIFACLVSVAFAISKSCTWDFCHKEELSGCRNADKGLTREQCNSQGGLYITFREGNFSSAQHKCCNWKMSDITQKYLYCVRNIRGREQLCTTESIKYKVKVKTQDECNKFSCT